ncbi:MAG: signal recognition particle receptor subunit alpha [Candidatus Altiarchaeales archaeon]|nr:signal recognition particle receptor subunit alpha [Candidatus Altiarchaeota archaeon]MBU4341707.1 signal recognition particle receptor subunit alpha [Candidatus Altiarchaeota archaeon]MBU4437311.1 signal recognition particle receptor subunit alpha [Candidatus Altiarchaeota archaeon]MCG2783408.1 signal recognition particle receptor subunit alpha [Candidatus Altiarchaeales archaeon]
MVFEKLSEGLQSSITNLRKAVVVDKKTVKNYTKEIQKTLLSADVQIEQVFELSKRIEDRGLLEKPPGMLSRKENLIRITYEELVNLLGKGEPVEIQDGQKLLLVGTQGSGKTTTVAKLGRYFKKKGMHPKLICADTFRPAAYEQLKQLSEEIKLPFYGNPGEKNALNIIKEGIKEFKNEGLILIDSEGRHKLDKELMKDINKIYKEIKPERVLLILDGTTGQQAGKEAEAFKNSSQVDGIILTKLDGTAKGGGAISACSATGSGVNFIGTGEHINDFEEFNPEGFVSRLIGFGDLEGLLEKAKEVDFDEKAAERMMSGKFNMNDIYSQIQQMKKMGPMKQVAGMLPFGAKIPKDMLDMQEEKLEKFIYIMDSMTPDEREDPTLIKRERIGRISSGSGTKPEDVRELINYHKKMKKMMRMFGDERKLKRLMKRLGGVGM